MFACHLDRFRLPYGSLLIEPEPDHQLLTVGDPEQGEIEVFEIWPMEPPA